jgi:hypothetical protein
MNTIRAVLGLSFLSSALAFSPGFPYGTTKVRGVNLGGWLVLEVCLEYLSVVLRAADAPLSRG